MKRILYTALVCATLLAGFIGGQRYAIERATLAFRTDGRFELNLNAHRWLKDNQTTQQLY